MPSETARWLSFTDWLQSEGLRRLASSWVRMLFCLLAGAVLAFGVPMRMSDVATTSIAPFGSLLLGMSFAWSVTITSLLQSKQGQAFGEQRDGLHYRTFVMKFLFSLAVVFATTGLWAIVGARAFDALAEDVGPWTRLTGRTMMFSLTALMVTELWDGIGDVARMLLSTEWIRRHQLKDEPVTCAGQTTERTAPTTETAAPAASSKSTGVRVDSGSEQVHDENPAERRQQTPSRGSRR